MEINWSTFILEIINFIVLVWILKRFLYAPIQKTVAQRKAAIQKDLQDAGDLRQQALVLQQKYENRLMDWEKEKETKKHALQHEMEAEKNRQLESLQVLLVKESEKHQAVAQHQIADIIAKKKKECIDAGLKFTAKLLTQFASQELEQKIIALFFVNLQALSPETLATLKEELGVDTALVKVKTAFALDDAQKQQLIEVLTKMLQHKFEFAFALDQELLAGVYVELESIVFHLNLRDELQFLAKVATHE